MDVPGMVLVEVGPVVVLSSSKTSSSRMLSVLTHTTVTATFPQSQDNKMGRA